MSLLNAKVFNKRIVRIIILTIWIALSFVIASSAEDNRPNNVDTDGNYTDFSLEVTDAISESSGEAKKPEDKLYRRLLIVGNSDFDLSFLEGASEIVSSGDGLFFVMFDSALNAEKAFEVLSEMKEISSVEYDATIEANNAFKLSYSALTSGKHLSWGPACIGSDEYISAMARDNLNTVTVAVVDSGVDGNHSFLSSKLIDGYNFVENNSSPYDRDGHGTHVAGIVADCTMNTNNIRIMPVRVLDEKGEGELSAIANGILYACDNGASVINISAGGNHSFYLDAAMKRVIRRGSAVVAAAGNDAFDIDAIGICPAHVKEAITVGAIDSSYRYAQYSNYGRSLDFVAPGTGINSTFLNNSFARYSGTSMAAPHVSAGIALLESHYGVLSNAEIESLLKRSCITYYDKLHYGNGVVDMRNLASSISKQKISISKKSFVYSGKDIKPSVSVTRNGQSLFNGKDYSVTYTDNKNVGSAKAIIKGKGTYGGSSVISYDIVPKGTGIVKITPKNRGFTIKWKKQTKQTSGYEIQYSLKRNFKKAKSVKIKSVRTTKKKISKLKSNKKYYIRIRAYKNVNGKKYNSKWSKTARIVTE